VITDLRQSPAWGKYLESLGWKAVKLDRRVQALVRKVPFLGSVIKIQRPPKIPFEKIDRLAKKERALFVKLEPVDKKPSLRSHGFRKDGWPLLPPRTLHIDLTPPLTKIKSRFSKDARQAIRKAAENSLRCEIIDIKSTKFTQSFEQSYKILKSVGRARKFRTPPRHDLLNKFRAFGDNAWLAVCITRGNILGCAVVLVNGSTAFYHHAAVSPEGRQLHAAYLLMWKIIKKARAEGLKTLDLEGIYDPRFKKLTRNWQRFTIFKRKFGGKEIAYPGSYIKYYWPIKLGFKSHAPSTKSQ